MIIWQRHAVNYDSLVVTHSLLLLILLLTNSNNMLNSALFATICNFRAFYHTPHNSLQNRAFRGKRRRNKTMIKVLFICHGNICRSTMAESVFTHKVKMLGLSDQFLIDSFATSTEEIGNPPHRGTVNKLREVGIPLVPHRAKQITWADYEKSDYIIGMDSANMRNLNRMLKNDPEEKLYKFLTFAGSGRDIQEGCEGFLDYLEKHGEIHY